MQKFLTAAVVCLAAGVPCLGQAEMPWTQLPLSACQVDAFNKANPNINGKGIVVAVLDTGVDMGVPGLKTTPEGEVKVVDAQDFSGQGDVKIARATWNQEKDKIVRYADDGAPQLYTPPPADLRPEGTTVWFGLIEEKAYANSAVSDVNDNGKKDDAFGLCVISRDSGHDDDAACFVDTDGDRDLADEKPLHNYKLNYDTFTFAREEKESQIIPLTIALNIFIGERKVVLHHDDGGHGTHVAGIAAGCRIMNQDGFNGVAPGAQVISLKIGSNALAGGATTTGSKQAAFNYAAKYAKEHNVTVVCNLSFGIGSIREGNHDIDEFVDKLLRKNPDLIVCTSAGNEGPGLSSVGTPAGANAAISVAAILAADTARDVLGLELPHAVVTTFSSRGGELDKPDVATPGQVTSTVPTWNRGGDFWGGTSMASPYAAGMSALLAHYVREKQQIAPRADWIKNALKNTAQPVPGFNTLDYGGGIPNMVEAAKKVDALAVKYRNDPLFTFEVKTESPTAVDGSGRAAFWRTPWFPTERTQAFTVTPVFVPQADMSNITGFSKRLTLRCDADWCKPEQQQIYFRDDQSATVNVKYDAGKLTKPGLYVATIEGLDGDEVLLRLVTAIVVPHRVKPEDGYRIRLDGQTVEGYKVNRYFFYPPAGASAMHVTLRAAEGQYSTAGINYIYRPDGTQTAGGRLRLDTQNDRKEVSHTVSEDLRAGVWELPVTCRADKQSAYSLEVRFDGVQAMPEAIDDLTCDPGSSPSGDVTFVNSFDRPTTVTLSGQIEGYRKTAEKKATPDESKQTVPIAFTSKVRAVRIRVEVSDKDYAKFTDCAINVYDAGGKALAQNGLSETFLEMNVDNPAPEADSTSCSLEIQPAFCQRNTEDSAEFDVKVDYLYKEPTNVSVTRGDGAQVTLYPGVPTEASWSADAVPPAPPDEAVTLGYLRATERGANQPVAEVEILAKKK